MELVARDLKATGLHGAGVEFRGRRVRMRHELTPAQIEIYDTYADGWGILCAAAHKIAYREVAVMRRNTANARNTENISPRQLHIIS